MAAAELFGCRFQVYRNGRIFYTFRQPPMPLKHLRLTGDDFSSGHFDVYECLNSQKLDVILSMKPIVCLQRLTEAECHFNTSPTNTVVIETNHETQTDYDSSNPSCEVLSSSEVAVTATAGHNVTLPCRYLSFRFGVNSSCWGCGECPLTGQCGSNEIYKWDDQVLRISEKYQLTGDIQRGDLSLTVVNVTMEDSGPYCCLIEILGPFNEVKNSIRLTVTEDGDTKDQCVFVPNTTEGTVHILYVYFKETNLSHQVLLDHTVMMWLSYKDDGGFTLLISKATPSPSRLRALPNLVSLLTLGDISRGKTHNVHEEETAIFTCNYSIKYGLRPVCWGKACGTMWCHDEVIQTDGQRVTSKRSSRYTLKGDMLGGDVSLTIQQVKPTDAGSYCCRVDIEGYFNDLKVLHTLHVLKGNWIEDDTPSVSGARPPESNATLSRPSDIEESTVKGQHSNIAMLVACVTASVLTVLSSLAALIFKCE
ncbi:TIMD4 protein, partial [Polypterus senegalus]